MSIQTLIADDHQLFREGIVNLLSQSEHIEIIGQTENGENTLEFLRTRQPDVILMDIGMPVLNGLEATDIIHKKYPDIKIIALSMYADKHYIKGMLEAGASGYLFKDCTYDQLTDAITMVHEGKKYLSDKITEIMIHNYIGKETDHQKPKSDLSEREYEILRLIAEGFTASEIATQLYISVKTVNSHKQNVYEKLELKSSADIIKYAIKKGIVSL